MKRCAWLVIVALAACQEDQSSPIGDAAGAEDARAPDAEARDASEPDSGESDTGEIIDASAFEDAEPSDTGVARDPCAGPGGACSSPPECGMPAPGPSNCESCVPLVRTLCVASACRMPDELEASDVYELSFTADASVPRLSSLVWMAVAAATPAGFPITCAEVYAGAFDPMNTCYNVLDVRYREITQPGDTYSILFGGFASGQHTLFVVYGHDQIRGRGAPVGVSCTERDVGLPGSGIVRFQGGAMILP